MNIHCYFCGYDGTTYAHKPISNRYYNPQELTAPPSLNLDYECPRCTNEYGVTPTTYFGVTYRGSMFTLEFCQVAIKNWTISVGEKHMTLTHWATATHIVSKDYPKSPFSQTKVARVSLSYLIKRYSILEPFA